jgi:CMP-N-acetylneuraminic acid synthetase
MNVREIREKAKALKVKNYGKLTKEQLIRAVQVAEGNSDCFGKIENCGQSDCCWLEDCQA